MSWGIDVTGTKAGALKKVAEQLDRIAATYEGKEEGKDVLAAKERIVSLVEALALGPDQYGTDWNAVNVKAGGSHSTTSGDKPLLSATMQITVSRTSLALDPV